MPTKKKNVELPNTLSGLLRLAVTDARRVAKDPRYTLNMSTWHTPRRAGKGKRVCQVCMAGAVMTQLPGVRVDREIEPYNLPEDLQRKMTAIDMMRSGFFGAAFDALHPERLRTPDERAAMELAHTAVCSTYRLNTEAADRYARASWASYLRAAKILEAAGL